MTVKNYSEEDSVNVAVDSNYTKDVLIPRADFVVRNHAVNNLIFKNKKRITLTSSSFFSDVFSSSIGDAVKTIGSQELEGSKYIQPRGEMDELSVRKMSLNDYLQTFKRASRSDTLEYGMISKCDELLLSWFTESPAQLGNIISHIFIQSMSDKNILLSLLKAISNLSYESIYPFGQTVAVAALVNKDVEVIEGGIRAFENWGSREGVSVLENTKLAFDWLELYRQQTIAYLREF